MSKRILVSVISDLVTDQRVHRVCNTLHEHGYKVILVGRCKHDSLPMPNRGYKTVRFALGIQKGPLMYTAFNIRLFIYLLFHRADLLLANDLDTLLPNYLVAKLYKKPLVYDSHEYFTGVPELVNRPRVQAIWKAIERFIIPKLKYFYTVNASIAGLYEKEYGVKAKIVRNTPLLTVTKPTTALPFEVHKDKKIVLYQGAGINVDRGLEEAIEAFHAIENAILLVIGSGDVIEQLKTQVHKTGLVSKVFFIPKVPFEQLKQLTMLADIGLTLDKGTNINYQFSLPNKLFDYIHAGLPVLASRVREVERIINDYKVGAFIDNHQPLHIAARINAMLENPVKMKEWKTNALKAAQELCWQKEQHIVLDITESALNSSFGKASPYHIL